MSDDSDPSLIQQWKSGWHFLWRLFFIGFGFWLVLFLLGFLLDLASLQTSAGKVMGRITVALLALVGLPLLVYWAKRWWEATR